MKPSNEHVQEWAQEWEAEWQIQCQSKQCDSWEWFGRKNAYIAHKAYTAGRESMREEAAKVCEALANNYLHLSTTTDAIRVELAYLYKQAAAMHCHNEIRDLPISEE